MPTWHYKDGSSKQVSGVEYERLQEQAEEEWYEAYAMAKWLAWCNWTDEFGANNPNFPFNPNSREVFAEAERLMWH